MSPLLYLTFCSVRNRLRVRLRRLKEPRYLIGLIVGLGYFWMMFGMPGRSRLRPPGPEVQSALHNVRLPLEIGGAAVLFLFCASAWIPQGPKRPTLNFTRSDVQFLFPAPLTRGELIRYKLLRTQVGILISSVFMTFVLRRFSPINGWVLFAGVALTLTILSLHLTGASLRRRRAQQWLQLTLVAGATIVLVGTVGLHWSRLSTLGWADYITEWARLGSTGAAGVVLWPFRAVVRLPLAETPMAFLVALPWVLLIMFLHYIWVVRSDASFEEGSAEFAEKVALIRKGPQPYAPKLKRATPTPFTLSLEGPAELAICWKNLISVGRYVSLRALFRILPLVVLVAILARGRGANGSGTGFAVVCGATFVISVLLGPQVARNDLRQDLANLVVLKTWPINGATLVRGEVMAPAIVLTALAWLAALGGLIFAQALRVELSWIVAAAIVAPGVILLQLIVHNAIAATWPSLVVTGPSRARGIDVMGQRLITMFGLLIVLVVAVLPAAIIAGLAGVTLRILTGTFIVIVPAILAVIVLFVEAWLASEAVGKILDRTNLSAIDPQE